jgi:hypothetical protein
MREEVFRNQPADRRDAAKAAMAKYVITISTMDNTQTWLLTGANHSGVLPESEAILIFNVSSAKLCQKDILKIKRGIKMMTAAKPSWE